MLNLLSVEVKKEQVVNRGFFGIGIYHPKHSCNQGTLWRSAHAFGADFIFTVGPRFMKQSSDTTAAWRHTPCYNFADTSDLVAHLPYSCPLIGVELDERAVPLEKFSHPERAVYILGREDYGLPPKVRIACHSIVQIPSSLCLNVATAGSIVLYDRRAKNAR